MRAPGVSIVVPLHDGAATVIETLDSVRAQTHQDWELIVVDDASTDGGPDLVRTWAVGVDQPVRVLEADSTEPVGPGATRNRGLHEADAPVAAFLDADDLWDPTFLARRTEALAADPSVALVWGPARYWYPEDPDLDFDQPTGLDPRLRSYQPAEPLAAWITDLRHTPCPSASLFRREALRAVGAFPEDLRRGEDIAACALVAADHRTVHDPDVLVRYRRHAASSTTSAGPGRQRDEDVAFGRWLVSWLGTRPDLRRLQPLAVRCLHDLGRRAVDGRPFLAGRRQITRTVLTQRGARGRWWAVALDWVLPLRWSRRVAGSLDRAIGAVPALVAG